MGGNRSRTDFACWISVKALPGIPTPMKLYFPFRLRGERSLELTI
uniref:Uncharacterized protein n=1 Tax=Arundo donax TaxID=35708 RepID=A0A0A9C3V8_ARUDO